MKNVVIIGATSTIAQAVMKQFQKSSKLFLVARDMKKLELIKKDIEIRSASIIKTVKLDVNDTFELEKLYTSARSFLGSIDVVLIAHGVLPDQEQCNKEIEVGLDAFKTNAVSTIGLCQHAANILGEQEYGVLAVISSVAGDRGRQSNYIYGAAKSAVNTCLQGLRNRLNSSNVAVLTIKPGFVDTPMTAKFPKNKFFTSPDVIAKGIVNAIKKEKSGEIYLPFYWKIIMFIIKLIPDKIFNRLSL